MDFGVTPRLSETAKAAGPPPPLLLSPPPLLSRVRGHAQIVGNREGGRPPPPLCGPPPPPLRAGEESRAATLLPLWGSCPRSGLRGLATTPPPSPSGSSPARRPGPDCAP